MRVMIMELLNAQYRKLRFKMQPLFKDCVCERNFEIRILATSVMCCTYLASNPLGCPKVLLQIWLPVGPTFSAR